MIPVQYWNVWTWLALVLCLVNLFSLIFGGGGIIAFLFAGACGYSFWMNVRR